MVRLQSRRSKNCAATIAMTKPVALLALLALAPTPAPSPRVECIGDAFTRDLGPIACWPLHPSPTPSPTPTPLPPSIPYLLFCDSPRHCFVYKRQHDGSYVQVPDPPAVPTDNPQAKPAWTIGPSGEPH